MIEEAASPSIFTPLLTCGLTANVETMPAGDSRVTTLKSSLDPLAPMEAHISQLLDVMERYGELFRGTQCEARLAVHLTYSVENAGGWTLSSSLLQSLVQWPVDVVIAIEYKSKQPARLESV
jgi:hypothetical protein